MQAAVKFDTDVADKEGFEEYGKDVAMQVAAANPGYLNETEVPAEVLEKEKEILKVQAINEGKPEAIAEKMVQGRIKKFYKENCLMDQEFIKPSNLTPKQKQKSLAARSKSSLSFAMKRAKASKRKTMTLQAKLQA